MDRIDYEDLYAMGMNLHWQARAHDVPMCQHESCDRGAMTCEYADGALTYYCPRHAAEEGFCCVCGTFIAGWIDDDDKCDNCRRELEDTFDDEDEDDDYYDDDFFEEQL